MSSYMNTNAFAGRVALASVPHFLSTGVEGQCCSFEGKVKKPGQSGLLSGAAARKQIQSSFRQRSWNVNRVSRRYHRFQSDNLSVLEDTSGSTPWWDVATEDTQL